MSFPELWRSPHPSTAEAHIPGSSGFQRIPPTPAPAEAGPQGSDVF